MLKAIMSAAETQPPPIRDFHGHTRLFRVLSFFMSISFICSRAPRRNRRGALLFLLRR